MPLVISTALIVVSNILYAYVQSIDNFLVSNKWWLMLARFIMGIGAGGCAANRSAVSRNCSLGVLANSTIMRSYSSSATTLTERTAVMANLSAYQGVGFILGPREFRLLALVSPNQDRSLLVIQALFAFIGYPGPVHKSWVR